MWIWLEPVETVLILLMCLPLLHLSLQQPDSVAKHGNRSISSKSGAGDVLEALGVNIMAEPAKVEACVEKAGIGFMFAQLFNKSMKYVGQARKEMGVRTVFNILGPLANPSRAKIWW